MGSGDKAEADLFPGGSNYLTALRWSELEGGSVEVGSA